MFDRRLEQTNWELLSFIQSVWLTASASTHNQFIKIIVLASRGSSLIFLLFTAFQVGLILVVGGEHVFMTSNPMLCCDAFNEDFYVSSDHCKNKLRETHVWNYGEELHSAFNWPLPLQSCLGALYDAPFRLHTVEMISKSWKIRFCCFLKFPHNKNILSTLILCHLSFLLFSLLVETMSHWERQNAELLTLNVKKKTILLLFS